MFREVVSQHFKYQEASFDVKMGNISISCSTIGIVKEYIKYEIERFLILWYIIDIANLKFNFDVSRISIIICIFSSSLN